MKLAVAYEKVNRILNGLFLNRERAFEPRQGLVIDPVRRFGDNGTFDQQPGAMDGFNVVSVDRARARDPDFSHIDVLIDDAGAGTVRHLQDAFGRKRLNGASDGFPTDREQRSQFPLARQLVSQMQDAGSDKRAQLVAYFFPNRALVDLGPRPRNLRENRLRFEAGGHR